MALSEALVLSVGPAVATAILKVWLKDSNLLQDVGASVIDAIKAKISDTYAQQKAKRQFEEVGERVAQALQPLFDAEGLNLEDNQKTAIAIGVADCFQRTPISADILLHGDLDPQRLVAVFNSCRPQATTGFTAVELSVFDRVLTEACSYVVDIASQLPAFSERAFSEVLKRESAVLDLAKEILAEVRRISQGSAQADPETEGARFETDYRRQVGRKLDELELT